MGRRRSDGVCNLTIDNPLEDRVIAVEAEVVRTVPPSSHSTKRDRIRSHAALVGARRNVPRQARSSPHFFRAAMGSVGETAASTLGRTASTSRRSRTLTCPGPCARCLGASPAGYEEWA